MNPSRAPRRAWRRHLPGIGAVLRVVACALALSGSAHAEAPPDATARAVEFNETGSELYAAGNYPDALKAFQRAYSLVAEPNVLFNIAGCHERLGQRTRAVEYYRWFLSSVSSNPEGRRRAIEALSRLEVNPPAGEPAPPPPDEASVVWPLATLGAGLLFAGLGAGLYLDGAHDHNDVTNAPSRGASGASTLTEVAAQRLIDSGDTKKIIGGIGIGVGSALLVTHVAITLWRAGKDEPSASTGELRLIPGGWAVAGKF